MGQLRELSRKTIDEYTRALGRIGVPVANVVPVNGFGDATRARVGPVDPSVWEPMNEPSRAMLRAALKWADPENGPAFAALIPIAKRVKRKKKYPTSEEVEAFKKALFEVKGPRGLVLRTMLALGLRTEEMLALPRQALQDALKRGTLVVVRKGSVEHELPAKHVASLFRTLLKTDVVNADTLDVRNWTQVYELISPNKLDSAHRTLARLIKTIAPNWHPHMLRHAFATELIRSGATLPIVQRALGHSSYQTTIKNYVHVDAGDLEKWMKEE